MAASLFHGSSSGAGCIARHLLSEFEVVLIRAAFLLSFVDVLRINELVVYSKWNSSKQALQLNDAEWLVSGIHIRITASKTVQLAQVYLSRGADGHCPCTALPNYLVIRPAGNLLLLCHQDGSLFIQFPLREVLQRAIVSDGWQHEHFTFHSLQNGVATTGFGVWATSGSEAMALLCLLILYPSFARWFLLE